MHRLTFVALGGAVMFAGATMAAADELVLGAEQLDQVTAAGTVNFDTNVLKIVDIDKTVDLTVNKTVFSDVDVDGYLATAEASADAIEFSNNLAETDSFAQVSSSGAYSFSEALAAGNGGFVPPTGP
ncbi:MAG: hypothetical protein AAFX81_13425 [Pseudomonadota bacterium]